MSEGTCSDLRLMMAQKRTRELRLLRNKKVKFSTGQTTLLHFDRDSGHDCAGHDPQRVDSAHEVGLFFEDFEQLAVEVGP